MRGKVWTMSNIPNTHKVGVKLDRMSPVRQFCRSGRVGVWCVRRTPRQWGHLLPWLAFIPGKSTALDSVRFATQAEALAAVRRAIATHSTEVAA
jgi:hypothetical protein